MMETQICINCNQEKEITKFSFIRNTKNINNVCSYCSDKIRKKKYYKKKSQTLKKICKSKANILNNENIDIRLEAITKTIKRIGDYKKSSEKIEFMCSTCNHHWLALVGNLLHCRKPTGCPKCNSHRNTRLTNEEVDERMANTNIMRVDDYINNYTRITWKCKVCNNQWLAKADNIINNNRGCPKCYNKYTDEKLDHHLLQCDFTKLEGNVTWAGSRIKFQCKINDNHIWDATAGNIIGNNRGCPFCVYKGEYKLHDILSKIQNIEKIEKNYLIYIKNKKILVDFAVFIDNRIILIERNGEQHYMPVNFGQGKEKSIKDFENQKIRDNQLVIYCKENNIPLIEIKYNLNEQQIIKILKTHFLINT